MRTLITAAVLLAAGSGLMQAGSYKSLEIQKVDNTVAVVAAEDLTLTVNGENVVLSNPGGEIAQMRADEIARMAFTDEKPSSLNGITAEAERPVTVYTLGGAVAGEFSSLDEALHTLTAGTYIINRGEGNAVKIYIGK